MSGWWGRQTPSNASSAVLTASVRSAGDSGSSAWSSSARYESGAADDSNPLRGPCLALTASAISATRRASRCRFVSSGRRKSVSSEQPRKAGLRCGLASSSVVAIPGPASVEDIERLLGGPQVVTVDHGTCAEAGCDHEAHAPSCLLVPADVGPDGVEGQAPVVHRQAGADQ